MKTASRMPPRYRTSTVDGGRVVQLTTADGQWVKYRCIGGYVYVVSLPGHPGTLGPQACDRLQGSGDTLTVRDDAALAVVIAREARACYRVDLLPAYLLPAQGKEPRS